MTTKRNGFTFPLMLAAGAILAVLAVTGFEMLPSWDTDARLRIDPNDTVISAGESFTINIVVDARSPVNVFAGELHFDENIVTIESIDYNTSIADLWAEKPWYENGAGTMNFGGGTTVRGGFTGTGNLVTIRFSAKNPGDAKLSLVHGQILRHDGLGTEIPQPSSIDAILSVIKTPDTRTNARVAVAHEVPSRDLNNDGKVTFADASVIMLNLLSYNTRYDLNQDGRIDMDDIRLITND